MNLTRGAHACHLYETRGEQREVTLHFIQEGLARGEYCLHVTSDSSVDDWYNAFQAPDIDVLSERIRGGLEVLNALDWYQATDFHSVTQARRLWQLIDGKLEHFAGVRLAADMRWTKEYLPTPGLCHWEATANLIFENVDARAICQYDLEHHSAAEVHAALRTHPVVIYNGRSQPNPYYEAPTILANEPFLNDSDADASAIEAMLRTFRDIPVD